MLEDGAERTEKLQTKEGTTKATKQKLKESYIQRNRPKQFLQEVRKLFYRKLQDFLQEVLYFYQKHPVKPLGRPESIMKKDLKLEVC